MKKIYYISAFLLLFVIGCETTTGPNREASILTLNELKGTPGYEWYQLEYDRYIPNSSIIADIKKNYNDNTFYLYVNPSCACSGTQKLFPSIMKCLLSAGVPESKINLYSMLEAGYKHNMMNNFNVKSLPSCYIQKSANYYSIVDSLNKYLLLNPTDSINVVEKIILNSLK